MGTVSILDSTTRNPITLIGERAGICWGADISNAEKNYKRGLDCIQSGHGRTLEFVNVDMLIDGYSARVIREYMRHVGGGLTVLQASTRYINYENFEYITPDSIIRNEAANDIYFKAMCTIQAALKLLEGIKIPREDAAMLLPLGMTTRLVDHKNLRNLIDMSRTRMCNRAYWEFRQLFNDILYALSEVSDEWRTIVRTQMKRKCEVLGYCPETHGCGAYPKAGEKNG